MTYEAVNSISTERSYDTADEVERVACAVRALVAKTAPDDTQLWLPLLIHLRDTAAVMEYLTARWLPEQYCVSLGLQREEFSVWRLGRRCCTISGKQPQISSAKSRLSSRNCVNAWKRPAWRSGFKRESSSM